jgi:hypothetical protein
MITLGMLAGRSEPACWTLFRPVRSYIIAGSKLGEYGVTDELCVL